MRRTLVLAALCVLWAPVLTPARAGAVFIHGKGGADLANASVARAYWGEDMLRASTKNWSVPYLVVHYDGTQFMWVAGDTVAEQIPTWMLANGVDDIVVNTHSFGGVVFRWILSNPTWDARYQPVIDGVRWGNTLAGTHKRSEATDPQAT